MLQARKLRHVLAKAGRTHWRTIQMDSTICVCVSDMHVVLRLPHVTLVSSRYPCPRERACSPTVHQVLGN